MEGWHLGDGPGDDGRGRVDDAPPRSLDASHGHASQAPVRGAAPATVGAAVGALLARRVQAVRPQRAAASLARLATLMGAVPGDAVDEDALDDQAGHRDEAAGVLAAPRGLGSGAGARGAAGVAADAGDVAGDGIDPPLSVGADERRMQVRAYNYWSSLLGDRRFPTIIDLAPETLEDFGPFGVLLDFTDGIDNPAVRFIGARLREECDVGTGVRRIDDVPSRSLLSRLTDHYLQIIANRAPIGFEAEYVNQRGATIMYRGILLPFSSDDETIDFIFGVINWKEAVPGALRDGLEAEVTQALRAAAASAPGDAASLAPVWADGPAASARLRAPAVTGAAPGTDSLDTPQPADEGLAHALADGGVDALPQRAQPGPGATLADWLAAARDEVALAEQAATRTRGALYAAVARAHDFATLATADPDGLAELYADAGLKPQARAPMTPLVKLVFGAGYDKTRLTEYATVLAHAAREGVAAGGLADYLDGYAGGLKALVRDERARRRADRPMPAMSPAEARAAKARAAAHDRLAAMPAAATVRLGPDAMMQGAPGAGAVESDPGEWVVLIGRRQRAGDIGFPGETGGGNGDGMGDDVAVVATLDVPPAWLDRVITTARRLG